MSYRDETDTYTVKIKAESEAAWLVSDGDDSDAPEVWLPKKLCEMQPHNAKPGMVAECEVPNWLAEQKGLLG